MQMLVRHFGGHENLVRGDARSPDAFADAAFGAIFAGGVDMAIAGRQRRRDDIAAVIAEPAGAEPDHGNPGTVPG